jgi:hypothetical protein
MPTVLHRTARRLTKKLGVHGSGLVLIAIMWTLIGISALSPQPAQPQPGAYLLHQYIPPVITATMWFTAGLGCLAAALDRNGPRRDGLALALAVIPPVIRVTSYLWSWGISLIPGDPAGSPRGWYAAALFSCLVALVWLVAAIPEENGNGKPHP